VRTRHLIQAVLQVGALAHLTWNLVRVAGAWNSSRMMPTSDLDLWMLLPPTGGALFDVAALALAPWISRAAPDLAVTDSGLGRAGEVVAAVWCLGAALQRAVAFLLRPDFEEAFPLYDPPEWGAHLQVPIYAFVAALLLVGPGRIGRWIRQTFGPIPIRD
jgi:hypothetical protein